MNIFRKKNNILLNLLADVTFYDAIRKLLISDYLHVRTFALICFYAVTKCKKHFQYKHVQLFKFSLTLLLLKYLHEHFSDFISYLLNKMLGSYFKISYLSCTCYVERCIKYSASIFFINISTLCDSCTFMIKVIINIFPSHHLTFLLKKINK